MVAGLLIALHGLPYWLRARALARRGRRVPPWRMWCFAAGLAVLVMAVSPPVLGLADSRFAAHMAEHLLIADVAALLLVLGLTGPLLAPLLRIRAVDRLRVLGHPVAAVALWTANLYLWHLPFAYEAALRHENVHVVQHLLFLLLGMNLWMPLFGPFPKPAWFGNGAQLVYIVVVRLVGAVLANVFVWSGTVFYGWYGDLENQSLAGAVMMVEESVITVGLFAWLFLKWMREGGERQQLLELADARGMKLDEGRVARAVAAGRGDDLRERLAGAAASAATEAETRATSAG
jgi:putative membrane protein